MAKNGRQPRQNGARPTGRPVDGKHVVGRESLIQTTAALLREQPPRTVTRAAIAQHAGVHPTLVNYYFKDRDSLVMAALEHLLAEVIADEPHRACREAAVADQIDDRVRAVARFSASVPGMQRLMLEELANSPSPLVRARLAEINRLAVDHYREIVELGVARGRLRPVEPLFLHMALVGMMDFFVSGEGILRSVLGHEVDLRETRAAYIDFVATLMIDGLRGQHALDPEPGEGNSRS